MSGIIHDLIKDRAKSERLCFDITLPYQIEVYVTQSKKTGTLVLACMVFQVPVRKDPRGLRKLTNDDLIPQDSFRCAVPFTVDPLAVDVPEGLTRFLDRVCTTWTEHQPANMRIRCRSSYGVLWTDSELRGMIPGREREVMRPVLDFLRFFQGGVVFDPLQQKMGAPGRVLDPTKFV